MQLSESRSRSRMQNGPSSLYALDQTAMWSKGPYLLLFYIYMMLLGCNIGFENCDNTRCSMHNSQQCIAHCAAVQFSLIAAVERCGHVCAGRQG